MRATVREATTPYTAACWPAYPAGGQAMPVWRPSTASRLTCKFPPAAPLHHGVRWREIIATVTNRHSSPSAVSVHTRHLKACFVDDWFDAAAGK